MTSTFRTQLLIWAIITAPALIISFIAGLSLGLPQVPPEIPPVDTASFEGPPAEDVHDLPRYPGAVRVKYENHLFEDARLWEVGYFAEGDVQEAGTFYRQKLKRNGWVFEGSHFDAGELALRAHRDTVEVLVEIGQSGELIEIEMELYEPLSS